MPKRKYPTGPIEESLSVDCDDDVIAISRTAAVVKGGRRFSFNALSVVGNRAGLVGLGYAKAKEVPNAVEKSVKEGKKRLMRVVRDGSTIPHMVEGRLCATKVRLVPAAPGTGVIAGRSVRKVVELAGIKDLLTKTYGSTNPMNVVKATMDALSRLGEKKTIENRRGGSIQGACTKRRASACATSRASASAAARAAASASRRPVATSARRR